MNISISEINEFEDSISAAEVEKAQTIREENQDNICRVITEAKKIAEQKFPAVFNKVEAAIKIQVKNHNRSLEYYLDMKQEASRSDLGWF